MIYNLVTIFIVPAYLLVILNVNLVQAQYFRTSTASSSSSSNNDVASNNCNTLYRNTRRSGGFVYGQFQIPVDTQYPKFQLQVKFNRQIQGLTVRQTRARDISGHREFSIGSIEPENGVVTFTSVARVGRTFLFGRAQIPRVTRIVYNGKTLCAANGESSINNASNGGMVFDNESVVIDIPLSSNSKKKVKKPTNTAKGNENYADLFEDDEDEGNTSATTKN